MKPNLTNLLEPCAAKVARTVLRGERGSNAPDLLDYSAVRAELPMPDDPNTQTNQKLLDLMNRAGNIVVAGEAGSHCVASTVRDLVDEAQKSGLQRPAEKITLLTDATCPVGGFEALQEKFIADLTTAGMRTASTASI